MLTFQDLEKYSTSEQTRVEFVLRAINEHESTPRFINGKRAGEFFRHHDPELEAYVKKIYDMQGNVYDDNVSSNHKLVSNFFYVFIDQAVAYLLGNGVSFDDPDIKTKLGNDFDYRLMEMLTFASCDGESYALYTGNGIEPFCYACRVSGNEPYFVPLYDERDGSLKAGIRYWRLAPDKPLRATLYEPDGFTEYNEDDDKSLVVMQEKRSYSNVNTSSDIEGVYETESGSSCLPIIRMGYINDQSALIGN